MATRKIRKPAKARTGARRKRARGANHIENLRRQCRRLTGAVAKARRIEKILRESETRNQALIAAFPDLVFINDSAGVFLDYHVANPESLLLAPERFIGKTIQEALPPALRDAVLPAFESFLATRTPQIVEYALEFPQGRQHFEARIVSGGTDRVMTLIQNVSHRKESETALRELRRIVNTSPAVAFLWRKTAEYPVEFVSDSIRQFGYSPDDLLSSRVSWLHQIIHPDDVARVLAETEAALAHDQSEFHQDYRILDADGRIHWVNDHTWVRRGEQGAVTHLQGLVVDTTSRHTTEEALRRSEAQYRALAEAAHDMIFIINADGIVEFANRHAAEQFGVAPEQLVGKSQAALFPGAVGQRQASSLAQVIESGLPLYRENRSSFPGGPAWLGTWLVPLLDDAHRPRAVLGIARDITDRVNAAHALRESEAKFRSMMEAMEDLVYICAPDHRIEYMNPAMIRRTGRDATGEICYRAVHGRDAACPWCARDIVQSGRSRQQEITSPKDNRTFWTTSSPLRHADASVSSMTVSHDVTETRRVEEERRRLEAQMQHAQKLESLGVLAGGIAHDFNNLLMAILGNLDLALLDVAPAAPIADTLRAAERAGHRAADLCRQMLAYSGKGQFLVGPVDVNAVIRDTAGMLEISISKKVALSFNLPESLPPILADATQFRQIVMNLVINASEAISNRPGIVSVSTGSMSCDRAYLADSVTRDDLSPGLYVFVEVRDTGCGMDQETTQRIFEPFFTTKFSGRGLGLAAVLGIVRSHKGTLKVASEPGKGSTFRILFPAADAGVAADAEEAAPEPPWRGQGRILIADDEPVVLQVGATMLSRLGFTPTPVADGYDALEAFRKAPADFACVILDLTMPNMDGIETAREIRAIDPSAKILIASGYSEDTTDLADSGANAFIQKPFSLKALETALRKMLAPPSPG